MADQTAVTKLVYDATGARQGATEFHDASERILADNRRVEAALTASRAKIATAAKANVGLGSSGDRTLAMAADRQTRLNQAAGTRFPAAGQKADSFEQRAAALERGMRTDLGTVAHGTEVAAAVTPTAIGPLVANAFGSIKAGDPQVSRGLRNIALTEAVDPTTKHALAEIHNTAASAAAQGIGLGGAPTRSVLGAAIPTAGGDTAIVQLTLAIDKLRLQLMAEPAQRQAEAAAQLAPAAAVASAPARAIEQTAAAGGAGIAPGAAAGVLGKSGIAPTATAEVAGAVAAEAATGERDLAAETKAAGAAAGQAVASETRLSGAFSSVWESVKGAASGLLGAVAPAQAAGHAHEELTHKTKETGEAMEGMRGQARRVHENFGLLSAGADGALGPMEALKFGIFGIGRELGLFKILLSPIGLTLTGIAAAIGFVAARAIETEGHLKQFDVALKAVGGGGTAEGLQETEEALRKLGVSGDKAHETLLNLAHTPEIAPELRESIARLAHDISAVQGGDIASWGNKLSEAFKNGYEATAKLGFELHALTADEAAQMRVMAQHGDIAGIQRLAIEALARSYGGAYEKSLTGASTAVHELGAAWDELIETLSKSDAINSVVTGLAGLVKEITGIVHELDEVTKFHPPQFVDPNKLLRSRQPGQAVLPPPENAPPGPSFWVRSGWARPIAPPPEVAPTPPGPSPAAQAAMAAPVPPMASAAAAAWGAAQAQTTAAVTKDSDETNKNTTATQHLSDVMGTLPDEIAKAIGAAVGTGALGTGAAGLGLGVPGAMAEPYRPQDIGGAAPTQISGALGGLGLKPQQIAGFLANFQAESGFDPTRVNKDSGATGIAQWLGSRLTELKATEGPAWNTVQGQVDFLVKELQGKFSGLLAAVKAAPDAGTAARIVGERYEGYGKPGEPAFDAEQARRAQLATQIAPKVAGGAGGIAPSAQQASIDIVKQQTEEYNRQNEALRQLGVAAAVTEAHNRALIEVQQRGIVGDQAQIYITNAETQARERFLIEFDKEHALQQRGISDSAEVAAAYKQSTVAGLEAAALAQARETQLNKGGDLLTRQRDILEGWAAEAVKAGSEQLAAAKPVIDAQEKLAAAALQGAEAERMQRIENEAALATFNALSKAQAAYAISQTPVNKALLEYAQAQDEAARSDAARKESAEAVVAIGHEIQGKQLESQTVGLQIGLQGAGTDALQQQIALLHVRQDLETKFLAASPEAKQAYQDEADALIQQNTALQEAERQTERINSLFEGIADTINGELAGAIRNALIRTPIEASEHIRHYWQDFRAGLKATIGDALSAVANFAFIKPLTGTIAGALGLGQQAQQIGTFATGGASMVAGGGGTDSQLVQFMATPGERVMVLTPPQAAHADRTGMLPHFAGGGMLDVSPGWFDWATPDTSRLRSPPASLDNIVGSRIARMITGRSEPAGPSIIERPIGLEDIVGSRLASPLRTAYDAIPTGLFEGGSAPLNVGEPVSAQWRNYERQHTVPAPAADPGFFDTIGADISDFAAHPIEHAEKQLSSYLPGFAGGGSMDVSPFGASVDPFGWDFPSTSQQFPSVPAGLGVPDAISAPKFPVPEFLNNDNPGVSGVSQVETGASHQIPVQTGNSPNQITGSTVNSDVSPFYGDPEAAGMVRASQAMQPAMASIGGAIMGQVREFGQAAVGVSQAGLKGESAFLSTAAADQPLVGFDTKTGEITGRIPALAEFMQQGLAGGAPGGSLGAGVRVGNKIAPALSEAERAATAGRPSISAMTATVTLGAGAQGEGAAAVSTANFGARAAEAVKPPGIIAYHGSPHGFGGPGDVRYDQPTGADVYGAAVRQVQDATYGTTFFGNPSAVATNTLREAGIPGIRYLDQGSRTAGEGTHNYVMFGDENIEILRKYGLVGPPSLEQQPDNSQPLPMLAAGGSVLQTGAAVVHQGEVVLSSASADNALQGFATGLQGVSGALGQTTPALKDLAHTSSLLSQAMSALKSAGSLFSPIGTANAAEAAPGDYSQIAPQLPAGFTGNPLNAAVNQDAFHQVGPASLAGVSSGQFTFNVPSLGNNSGLFAATAPGTSVFQNSIVTVPPLTSAATSTTTSGTPAPGIFATGGGGQVFAGTVPGAPTTAGTGGLSADQISSLLLQSAAGPSASQATTPIQIIQTGGAAAAPSTVSSGELGTQAADQISQAASTATTAAINAATQPTAISGLTSAATSVGTAALAGGAGSSINSFLFPQLSGGVGSLFGAGGISGAVNNFGGNLGFAVPETSDAAVAAGADYTSGATGSLFGSTTLGAALGGTLAGFGAGSLITSLIGRNQVGGEIGSGGGAVAGTLLGALLGPIGALAGGVIGGAVGGGLGSFVGGGPPGQSAGNVVGPSGNLLQQNDVGASAANIQTANQISGQLQSFLSALTQLTNAQGQPIGQVNTGGGIVVSSSNNAGITVGSNAFGNQSFDQNAAQAVTQTELEIVHSLTNVSGSLQTILQNVTDPSQLQAAVQFADVYDKLNITSAQLTANLQGNVDAVGPFQTALTSVNQTFSQLTAQANQFGVSVAPITQALDAVTQTLNQDFSISLDAALSTAIDGGNNFIQTLLGVHQAFVQNTTDATALANNQVSSGIAPAPAAAAGSASTPPGKILVGEKGPEWMLPHGASTWVQVGVQGPELIDQPGGAIILPNPLKPQDRAFADGTAGPLDQAISDYLSGTANTQESTQVLAALAAGQVPADQVGPVQTGTLAYEQSGTATGNVAQALADYGSGNPSASDIATVGAASTAGALTADQAAMVVTDQTAYQASATGIASGALSAPSQGSSVFGIGTNVATLASALSGAAGGPTLPSVANLADALGADASGTVGSVGGALGFATPIGTDFSSDVGSGITSAVDPGTLFGATTAGDALGAFGAGAAAGSLLNAVIGGNQLGSSIGSNAGSLAGTIAGSILGTPLLGGLIGGLLGSVIGGLFGPPPSNNSSGGDVNLANGAISDVQSSGVAGNDQATSDIGGAVSQFSTALQAATGGTIAGTLNVQAGSRDGIKASYSGPLGQINASFGKVSDASVNQATSAIELAIAQNLSGTSGPISAALSGLTSVSQLSTALQGAGVTFPPVGTTVPGFAGGTGGTPAGWILVGEAGPEWMFSKQGGATVLPNGVKPDQAHIPGYQSGTTDWGNYQISAPAGWSGTVTISAATAAQWQGLGATVTGIGGDSGPIPGLSDYQVSIRHPASTSLQGTSGEAAQWAQAGASVTALPSSQPATPAAAAAPAPSSTPLTADLTQAQAVQDIQGIETAQAAPTLAGLGTDQLQQVITDLATVAPEISTMAQSLVSSGNALPTLVTQQLEAVVNPLQLAIQQQGAQAYERTQVAAATGQDAATTAALNTASISQAIVQQLGNPQALMALAAVNGTPQGLTALQAGPALAGLGTDQLQALLTAIGNAAPQLTDMINALIASGTALPDALTQATESIDQAGLLAVQKAQALGYEQVQAAGAAGQNVGEAQQLATAEQAQAVAQATGTQIPINGLPDWATQLDEAIVNPLQLAVQKAQAAGIQQVQIAEQTGSGLVEAQKAASDSIQQIWYQATSSLTDLKNQLTGGSLSGLIPSQQVGASVEQFNQLLSLVQGGNTNFISQLAGAGQAAVQASQQAYGQGPETASVRSQILASIQPFLVSASGYPTSGSTALSSLASSIGGTDTGTGAATTATGTSTDLQDNTTALTDLTDALTGTSAGTLAAATTNQAGTTTAAGTTATTTAATSTTTGLTTNPVTGASFTGAGITAISPTLPIYPSSSTLSNALSDTIAGNATAADYISINEAVQAGIINAAETPQYAQAITAAAQYAAGQTANPTGLLAQALSDALTGTPTMAEWQTIIAAVNGGLINPVSDPKYATVIQHARVIANAQGTSLSAAPNSDTAYETVYKGLPAFAAGATGTPSGLILVGEMGPEWYRGAANDNWIQVGGIGPQLIDQPGGATILPFPVTPPGILSGGAQSASATGTIPGTVLSLSTSPAPAGLTASSLSGRSFAAGSGGLESIDLDHIPGFADGTMLPAMSFEPLSSNSADSTLSQGNERLLRALLMQVQAGNQQATNDASTAHKIARDIRTGVGPGIAAPARRAVG